ncbi:MAG TPA: hypothetical protein VM370_13090 [Candidatus Thermoplasmatota archaeon]|nr:hypothetical protein [Candidatus Thermoplasmatota archaeon]
MATPGELIAALEQLERALVEFTAAYEEWLREGGDGSELANLLADAERRLDAAREALARVQDALRA